MVKVIEIGKRWSDISKIIEGRTENSVKNRFNALFKIARKLKNIPKSKILKEKEEVEVLKHFIELKKEDNHIEEELDSKHKPRQKAQKSLEIIEEYKNYKKDYLKSIIGLGTFQKSLPNLQAQQNTNQESVSGMTLDHGTGGSNFRLNFSPIQSPIMGAYDFGFNRMYSALASSIDQLSIGNLGLDQNGIRKDTAMKSENRLPFALNSNNTSFASFSPHESPYNFQRDLNLKFKVRSTGENLLN